MARNRIFSATAVFDWSGAAGERLPGMALAVKRAGQAAELVVPQGGWSRARALAWIEQRIAARDDILIGLDVSAGLPFADLGAYFPGWEETPQDARALWSLIERHAREEPHFAANRFVAHPEASRYFRQTGALGDRYGEARSGRLRVTELASREAGVANPYCSLNLVGAAQVGKASLTAMRLLHRLNGRIAIWPMDPLPATGPALVEIYTSIAAVHLGLRKGRTKVRDRDSLEALFNAIGELPPAPLAQYDDHSTDALLTAVWLHRAQHDQTLWNPYGLNKYLERTEGWTFGVA